MLITRTRQQWMDWLNEEFKNLEPNRKKKRVNQEKFIKWIELILSLREEYESMEVY